MKNILILALNTLKVTFRKKSNILSYLIIPIISVVVIISVMGNKVGTKIKIGVVQQDSSIIVNDMLSYLESTGKFEQVTIDSKEVEQSIVDKKINIAIVIPKDFSEKIYNNKLESIKMISIQGKDVTALIENYTNSYINNLLDIAKASKGDKDKFNTIYNGYKNQGLKLQIEKLKDTRLSKELTQRSIGFLIMFVLIGATSTSNIILKEKRDKTYQRICSTSVNSKIYMLGNMLANLIIISIQSLLAILAITKILKIDIFMENYKLFFIMLLLGIVSISLGMILVSFSKTTVEAGNLSTLIIIPTCMLGGCYWPIELMPDKIQKISNFVPQKWAIEAISKIQSGASIKDIGLNIAILLGFSVVMFLIAAYKMKKSDKTGTFV